MKSRALVLLASLLAVSSFGSAAFAQKGDQQPDGDSGPNNKLGVVMNSEVTTRQRTESSTEEGRDRILRALRIDQNPEARRVVGVMEKLSAEVEKTITNYGAKCEADFEQYLKIAKNDRA